ncbi:Transcription cofactor vestigial-like protein 2 [Fukomys damarensis]|uniref:Transcription cofactor vestigial-like protein 2 n=1 Tax=Fukomys damarensis TaxID=885580 RepID=A0A091D1S3_FUKDA|nr:Transcription cofactor vestigial-like protein 2 [Fukomys damarensis]
MLCAYTWTKNVWFRGEAESTPQPYPQPPTTDPDFSLAFAAQASHRLVSKLVSKEDTFASRAVYEMERIWPSIPEQGQPLTGATQPAFTTRVRGGSGSLLTSLVDSSSCVARVPGLSRSFASPHSRASQRTPPSGTRSQTPAEDLKEKKEVVEEAENRRGAPANEEKVEREEDHKVDGEEEGDGEEEFGDEQEAEAATDGSPSSNSEDRGLGTKCCPVEAALSGVCAQKASDPLLISRGGHSLGTGASLHGHHRSGLAPAMETYTCVLSLPEQKLAYYSKMQEAPECTASPSSSGSSSFSSQTAASIKEEEGSSEKERPPEAEYINSRCVLLTYFQGDISSVVDEHFSRALSQPSSYSPSCASSKAARSTGPWRGEEGPCWAVVLSPPPASTQGTSDPNWEERQEGG